jgi:undecaprenyl pyrophosphate synthase
LLEKHNLGFMRHGDREGISQSLLEKLDTLQSTFVATGKKVVNLLFNYGGKWHIQDAMNRCVAS